MPRQTPFSTTYDFRMKDSLVGAQMLFVAFGALVLVPLLTGLDPNVALFTAGAGTLLFQLLTKRTVPIFLASSFAFIAPIIYGVKTWGIPGTLCGLAAAGIFYVLLSLGIKFFGSGFLKRLLPPVVVGPVIMVIGLILAPVAVFMALGKTGDGAVVLVPQNKALVVSMVTLLATSLASFLGGPPNTTYSEVTGAVTLTRLYNPAIMTWAAIFAILLAFIGKIGAILQTIPVPVMGGIMLLLFGAITVVGLNSLVKAGEDLTESRNLAIIALILVFGIGGMTFSVGEFSLKGIGLAGIVGVVLNLILPKGLWQNR